jgi:putative two-component system response regulator
VITVETPLAGPARRTRAYGGLGGEHGEGSFISNSHRIGDRPTVLIVDDTPENLTVIGELLSADYLVRAAISGERALRLVHSSPRPDLILLDVMMPGMDGYAVMEHLQRDHQTRDIPVIFITALDQQTDQLHGFDLGAVDYITKPIQPPVLEARVRTHLELKLARDRLQTQNAWLESEVNRRMAESELIQTISIRALAYLAETRDPETGNHILRTQGYVRLLASLLQPNPRFARHLGDHAIDILTRSAPLHDIGKVGIPDAILLKPGPLDLREWTIMKNHAYLGARAIEHAKRDAEKTVEFLDAAKEIAHWHHEKWDGSGYPDGLAGDGIPVSARLMALADVFDALTSVRVYKPAIPFGEARDIIAAGRGKHFDPDVTDAFLAHFQNFVTIARTYGDRGASRARR